MQGNEAIARAEILKEIAATCPEIYAEWAPEGKVTLAEKIIAEYFIPAMYELTPEIIEKSLKGSDYVVPEIRVKPEGRSLQYQGNNAGHTGRDGKGRTVTKS